MYASGVPLGLVVDAKGPRLAILIGAAALAIGYYPIHIGLSPRHGHWGSNILIYLCW